MKLDNADYVESDSEKNSMKKRRKRCKVELNIGNKS